MNFTQALCEQFNLQNWQAENIISLLDEGNTIPFIARYRKEAHGSLDDQTLREISEKLEYLKNMDKRRNEIKELIIGLGAMTNEINMSLDAAQTLTELEDIYRPFRPKRKTRASIAKEKGLQPLADYIFEQNINGQHPLELANKYINPENGIETAEDALQGALDIIAENLSDDASMRKRLRVVTSYNGILVSKATDPEKESVYESYYDFSEPLTKIADHRILAINRGEREKFLKVSIDIDEEKIMNIIYSVAIKHDSSCSEYIKQAAIDAYKRLISPSIEREIRNELTEKSCNQAIKLFSVNLRNLLMQPPVKGKITMGLDPGYRTGCKVAVVDQTGLVLDTTVIYPTHSKAKIEDAKQTITKLIKDYHIEAIAIGNGTASKETEIFTAEVLSELDDNTKKHVAYMVVNEAGASVYSASKLAAEEFPEFDLTLRSAISIARRLQDPLAELVKIDPKSIGVGLYQHDMPKKHLSEALNAVVEDCVNNVGVDLNTASPSLLSKVSGISPTISKNIVKYREENGEFKSRDELKKVNKLGPKAFEQCAGFLRVSEGNNILDNTAVHPESYKAAKEILKLCKYTKEDVKNNSISDLSSRIEKFGSDNICEQLGIGKPTLKDIVFELSKPGRDPRDELPKPMFRTDILDINDLKPGMELLGTVRNVIDFGAFIDVGVHQDGLVHISQICNKFIKHPSEILKVGDTVKVWVISVDTQKNRISLTMKQPLTVSVSNI